MRIGISGFVFQGGKSGVGVYFASLIKALQIVDKENRYFIHLSQNEQKAITLDNSNFSSVVSSNRMENPLLNIAWQNIVAPYEARKNRYDIFHVPTIRRTPLIKGCPVVTTVHDLAPFILRGKYDPLRTFYHHQILSRVIHHSNHVITVSHHTKKDLMEYLNYPEENITVVYPGLDHEVYKRKSQIEPTQKLVYVSRLEHPGKNHIRLIEAFETFKKRTNLPNRLVFAGADWNGAEVVKQRASISPYREEIEFLGFVTTDQIVSLYSSCALMIYPSLYEGFGLPIIEAMACGAPVICSNTSSLKEIGEGRALLFNPLDNQDIALSMEEGLKNSFQKKAREAGVSYAAKFSWEKTATEVIDVYRRVLS